MKRFETTLSLATSLSARKVVRPNNQDRVPKWSRRQLRAQFGQVVVEYVLLLVVVLAISSIVREYLLKSRFVQNFTLQPWERLDGMIQCGVWQRCGLRQQVAGLHPDSVERVLAIKPPQ